MACVNRESCDSNVSCPQCNGHFIPEDDGSETETIPETVAESLMQETCLWYSRQWVCRNMKFAFPGGTLDVSYTKEEGLVSELLIFCDMGIRSRQVLMEWDDTQKNDDDSWVRGEAFRNAFKVERRKFFMNHVMSRRDID
jgi:hypothetical protein